MAATRVARCLARARAINRLRLHLRRHDPAAPLTLPSPLPLSVALPALRSSPPSTALLFYKTLLSSSPSPLPSSFLQTLAKTLALSRRPHDLKTLLASPAAVSVSASDRLRLFSAAGDLTAAVQAFNAVKSSARRGRPGTEAYNLVLSAYAGAGAHAAATDTFLSLLRDGGLPNSRTFTVVIQHLVAAGKTGAAVEVFERMPGLRVRRTSKQFSVLAEAFAAAGDAGAVRKLLDELEDEGTPVPRAVVAAVARMRDSGLDVPDLVVTRVGYSVNNDDDEEDDGDDNDDDDESMRLVNSSRSTLSVTVNLSPSLGSIGLEGPVDLSQSLGLNGSDRLVNSSRSTLPVAVNPSPSLSSVGLDGPVDLSQSLGTVGSDRPVNSSWSPDLVGSEGLVNSPRSTVSLSSVNSSSSLGSVGSNGPVDPSQSLGSVGSDRPVNSSRSLSLVRSEGLVNWSRSTVSLSSVNSSSSLESCTGIDVPEPVITPGGFSSDNDDDEAKDDTRTLRLRPWLDTRELAKALEDWDEEEVAALEAARLVWTPGLVCKFLRGFKKPSTAWKFFHWVSRRLAPDRLTVARMVAILARAGEPVLAIQLLDKARAEGLPLPFGTIRLVIDFLGLAGDGAAAIKLFSNAESYTKTLSLVQKRLLCSSLLRALVKSKREEEAIEVMDRALEEGVDLDLQTFSGLVEFFAGQGDQRGVRAVLAAARRCGVQPDGFMGRVVARAHVKAGRPELAMRVLVDMLHAGVVPDSGTKDLVVKALWKEGKLREAAHLEKRTGDVHGGLPAAIPGHAWTASTADLLYIYELYRSSFS